MTGLHTLTFDVTGMTFMPRWTFYRSRLAMINPTYDDPFEVRLVPDHYNVHDVYACRVLWPTKRVYEPHADQDEITRRQIGWVPRPLNIELNAFMEGMNLEPHASIVEINFDPDLPRSLVRIFLTL